jgi:hypothetical protein
VRLSERDRSGAPIAARRGAINGSLPEAVEDHLLAHLTDPDKTARPSTAPISWSRLSQIDLLTRPKHSALPGLDIARYSPEPQSEVDRIDAARRPKRKLANPMLSRVASGAQRNGVAVGWFYPYAAVGASAHMRGL